MVGGEDDYVLGISGHDTDALKHRFNLKAEIVESAKGIEISQCCPWGWSKNARHQFLKAGVDSRVLPDDECIENMRQLSHRRTTITLMERLHSAGIFKTLPAVPIEITSINQLPKGRVYIKLPWSSSGRGVMACDTTKLSPASQGRIEGMIHRQCSVIVEPALDKVADFAMLFYVDSAVVNSRDIHYLTPTTQVHILATLLPHLSISRILLHDILILILQKS